MATRSSEKVAARRRALERAQAQESKRLEEIAEAAAGVSGESGILANLRRQVIEHEGQYREHVDALVKLGKTPEEIAELAEVDPTEVRASRRPKPAKKASSADSADGPAAGAEPVTS